MWFPRGWSRPLAAPHQPRSRYVVKHPAMHHDRLITIPKPQTRARQHPCRASSVTKCKSSTASFHPMFVSQRISSNPHYCLASHCLPDASTLVTASFAIDASREANPAEASPQRISRVFWQLGISTQHMQPKHPVPACRSKIMLSRAAGEAAGRLRVAVLTTHGLAHGMYLPPSGRQQKVHTPISQCAIIAKL